MNLKGKLGRVLLPLFLFTIFVVLPFVSIGAIWVQHVALLPGTAVVFPSDAAAMDRFMATVLKPYYGDRVGICDGTNDHVEVQAALDAVSEVRLSEGTFNCEVTIDVDSNQTLWGCGRNTILTTSTVNLIFLSAVGGAGTELTGITIADLQIDGGAGGVSECGISFQFVDYSLIENIYSRRHQSGTYPVGIKLVDSDSNIITKSTCQGNGYHGIYLSGSSRNIITDNTGQDSVTYSGIGLYSSSNYNVIDGNVCLNNKNNGIYLGSSSGNTINGNICQESVNYNGIVIYFSYDNSITGNTCENNGESGILAYSSSGNTINGNSCQGNGLTGVNLYYSSNCTAIGNVCIENFNGFALSNAFYNTINSNVCRNSHVTGIDQHASNYNTISDNTFIDTDGPGMYVYNSSYNAIIGNVCQLNDNAGIMVLHSSTNNIIEGNTCLENSQQLTNVDDDIVLTDNSSYNSVQNNVCRAGALAKRPRYGIYIEGGTCIGNLVIDNDLSGGGWGTSPFNDTGTGTKLNVLVVPFSRGTELITSGFQINAAAETAEAWLRLPNKVNQIVRMKIYARSTVAEADKMRLEFVIYGGADNEAYNIHSIAIANHPSTSSNFDAMDVIYWTVNTAAFLVLTAGDSVVIILLHESAGNGDCATDARFRTVEIEYV